ncbi:MAG: L,D-transpeptidase family protein, partial [Pseudomonadota bacterium]
RLTWGGVALHAGNLPGFPASHGCIRLPRGFSEALFEITDLGIPVIIADSKSQPETVVHPGLLLPPEAAEQTAAAVVAASNRAGKDVDPALDAHKHVSMVVSGADRTAIMMLGGSEVWRSTIKIRGEGPLGDHVYKLMGPAENGEGLEWLAHKIYTVDEGGEDPAAVLARIQIVDWPEAVEILADLAPGSTLVVTDLPATPETRHEGGDFIIIRSEDA